jgi:single-stranded-DNA-specific exonuclease
MSCLTVDDLTRTIRVDMELDLESVGMDLLNELARLEPFGAGNPRPMFISRNVRVAGQPLIMKEKHLKVRVACNGGQAHEAVWWSGVEELSERTLTVGAGIEMAYTIEPNFWQGIKKLQLSVKDIQFHN